MLSNKEMQFSSNNLDYYLKELAKEYRRLSKMPVEVILVGGASILANYGFRDITYDIDALFFASTAMEEAVHTIGDKLNLPNGWFNSDFKNTDSYTTRLNQYSQYYKTFSNIVDFRTITGEYLIAMKLRASRDYKSDLSDVAEIIAEHQRWGKPISYEDISTAVINLYDNIDCLPDKAISFLKKIFETTDLTKLINERKEYERTCKVLLVEFEKKYKGVLKEDNLDDIIAKLKEKENSFHHSVSEGKNAKHKKESRKFEYGD